MSNPDIHSPNPRVRILSTESPRGAYLPPARYHSLHLSAESDKVRRSESRTVVDVLQAQTVRFTQCLQFSKDMCGWKRYSCSLVCYLNPGEYQRYRVQLSGIVLGT
jgi:hypothetical protein